MADLETIPMGLDAAKKRLTKAFMTNVGLFTGLFLIFAVIVIMTTDIRIISFEDISSFGLDLFLLIFCSYAMYICCADSGAKSGTATSVYIDTVAKFDAMKKAIIESGKQTRLAEFCNYYIEDELRNARMSVLAVVGLSYEEYREKYMHLSAEFVDAITDLTDTQKKAIKKANGVKPVKLAPEMILRKGRSSNRRSPLEVNPVSKKNLLFGAKFVQISAISIGMSMIALDVIIEPSWVIFASVCLKLVSVVVNGFGGFKTGYDNISIDTVNYMSGQIDLMQQAFHYIEAHPITTTNE